MPGSNSRWTPEQRRAQGIAILVVFTTLAIWYTRWVIDVSLLIALPLWVAVMLGFLHSSGNLGQEFYKLPGAQYLDWLIAGQGVRQPPRPFVAERAPAPPPPKPAPRPSATGPSATSSPNPAPNPSPGRVAALDLPRLERQIAQEIDKALLGQSEVAKRLAATVRAALISSTTNSQKPFLALIVGREGCGRTTMLEKVRACLENTPNPALLISKSDAAPSVSELAKWPVLLIDDLDAQGNALCDALSHLIQGNPRGTKLILVATKDQGEVDDPLRQPIPQPAEEDRILSRLTRQGARALNEDPIVPQVPRLLDMVSLAADALSKRCRQDNLVFDIKASEEAIIRAIKIMGDSPVVHPGSWLPPLSKLADKELGRIRHGARLAKRVCLRAHQPGNLTLEILE